MSIDSAVEAVTEFHRAFEIPLRTEPTADIPQDRKFLRMELIREELQEFIEATFGMPAGSVDVHVDISQIPLSKIVSMDTDIVGVADALIDILYVVYGAAIEYGLPVKELFEEVHHSNMSKLDMQGKPIIREDGKIMKGENYYPPDLVKVLSTYKINKPKEQNER